MAPKITDLLISAILKRGILYEARNCDVDIDIPTTQQNEKGETEKISIAIRCKIEHVTIKIEKGQVV